MNKAITTKYLPATEHRPSRICARAEGKNQITITYSHSGREHDEAAFALCQKMNWTGKLIRGGLPDASGNAYVFLPYNLLLASKTRGPSADIIDLADANTLTL